VAVAVLQQILHHRMRSYYVAIAAGLVLIVSAFMPWMLVGEIGVGGVPDAAGLWVVGLGSAAIVLAGLSVWTRKNSRHPLLLVGLASFSIMFLAYQFMLRSAAEMAWARSQALAIVENASPGPQPDPGIGIGLYLGMGASLVLILFGLSIVIKRMPKPYAVGDDE
jgi:hypothetical protein